MHVAVFVRARGSVPAIDSPLIAKQLITVAIGSIIVVDPQPEAAPANDAIGVAARVSDAARAAELSPQEH